jgi:hypothetical protein
VHLDRGSKYLGKEFILHLKSRGIQQKLTVHDTPRAQRWCGTPQLCSKFPSAARAQPACRCSRWTKEGTSVLLITQLNPLQSDHPPTSPVVPFCLGTLTSTSSMPNKNAECRLVFSFYCFRPRCSVLAPGVWLTNLVELFYDVT